VSVYNIAEEHTKALEGQDSEKGRVHCCCSTLSSSRPYKHLKAPPAAPVWLSAAHSFPQGQAVQVLPKVMVVLPAAATSGNE
jgi:hypothetical protein